MHLTGTRARDPHEAHRAATPLELLFDLTFVVAVAAVVPQFAHAIVEDHPLEGLIGYAAVFFAIWWAWMNFTWFASAFDCDDAFYRVLTLVQMAGVLVLAAGVGPAFEESDYRTAVLGYVIMRGALVVQWLRVAVQVPAYRANALRFADRDHRRADAAGSSGCSSAEEASVSAFLLFAALELLIPVWADRGNTTPWHPHHIAERYGLFTIIVLGESVLATATAFIVSKDEVGVTLDLVVVAASGLVLLFALWWLYFLQASGPELERHRSLAFLWGYGHYFVFASLAAVGAGIEVVTEAITHDDPGRPAARRLQPGPAGRHLSRCSCGSSIRGWAATAAIRAGSSSASSSCSSASRCSRSPYRMAVVAALAGGRGCRAHRGQVVAQAPCRSRSRSW